MSPWKRIIGGRPLLRAAVPALALTLLWPCYVHGGTALCAHGEARRPRWIAQKEPRTGEDTRPRGERQGQPGRKTPAPATEKGGPSAPPKPLAPFTPSEKIKPGQAVDFPTDI